MEGKKDLQAINIDWEAEKICRWAAARAGVIVVAPLAGTMALMANEVYMITRLGDLRGVKLDEGAVLGLLASLGATFVGQTLATLIPFAPVQIPLAISVTYAVGRVANAWLQAGRPEDIAAFRAVYEEARREGAAHSEEFQRMDCRSTPLGDESRSFSAQVAKLFNSFTSRADAAESALSGSLQQVQEKIGQGWLSAQRLAELRHGSICLPYAAVAKRVGQALAGSGLTLLALDWYGDRQFYVQLEHESYGSAKCSFSVEEFYLGGERAEARLALADCQLQGQGAVRFITQLFGAKFIIAVLATLLENFSSSDGLVQAEYVDGSLSMDFAAAVRASRLGSMEFRQKKLTELLELTALTPTPRGLLLTARFKD